MNKFKALLVLPLYIILSSTLANAASYTGTFVVTQIVTDANRYAGCMVKVTPGPETRFQGCRTGFVTFGCDGTLGVSKVAAQQLLSTATLGFVMDKSVVLRINAELGPKSPRGYCLADRVDVKK